MWIKNGDGTEKDSLGETLKQDEDDTKKVYVGILWNVVSVLEFVGWRDGSITEMVAY